MIVHRFYCPNLPGASTTTVDLPEGEARHAAKVLRLRPGDQALLLNGQGLVCQAEISAVSRDARQVTCQIRERTLHREPSVRWHLYVAPPKGKTFDLVLRMATELGAWRIVPILCRYGVSRPEETSASWEQVLVTAMKQSVNPWLPAIESPCDFQTALAGASGCGFYGAVPSENEEARPLPSDKPDRCLWIGPEGGFTAEETTSLRLAGYQPLTVGRWVLRVETAVAALLGRII
jgi:16S rRNA (uracil1498-N3)-methyltransferase